MSVQDIRPNRQDTSNFYLANIYQVVANPNISNSLPTSPPPFSPPQYTVWVNALWFLSLVISLTCALLATFLQQWARRYLRVTQSRYSLHKRARIRAFFADGVKKLLLPWAVETLPTLIHISLSLFFAGLVVFLWNVDLTCFKLVLSWVCICSTLYGCITLMPIFHHDSPYYTSLSPLAWRTLLGAAWVISKVPGFLLSCTIYYHRTAERFLRFARSCHYLSVQGMQRIVEVTALKSPSSIDTCTFMWTFDRLDEDHELERFFSSLPSFRSSKVVKDPLPSLAGWQKWKLSDALLGLLDRSFSSDLLSAPVKKRRAIICAKAIEPAHNEKSFHIISKILSHYQYQGPIVAEVLQVARGWHNDRDEHTSLVAQATVSSIVAGTQRRNDPWFILASDELGVPKSALRDYAVHGDSLSLAILIHIIRQQFGLFWNAKQVRYRFTEVLYAASKFNVRDSSPELQHEFCALWNQVVLKARNGESVMAGCILKQTRNVYIALHEGTDCAPRRFSASTWYDDPILEQVSSYTLCNIPNHHPDSAALIHDIDTSSVPASAPLHIDDNLQAVPLLGDNIFPLASSYPCHPTTTESLRNPSASPDPDAAAGRARDTDTMPPTILEAPTSPSSVRSIDAIPPQNNPALLAPSDTLEIRFSASSEPVLDNTPPAGSSLSPMTDSDDHSPSFSGSHCPISVKTSPSGTSPWPTSQGSDKDARDPPSSTMTVLDSPPEVPSPTSATEKAVTFPLQREPDAGHAGDHPHASHSRYDIV